MILIRFLIIFLILSSCAYKKERVVSDTRSIVSSSEVDINPNSILIPHDTIYLHIEKQERVAASNQHILENSTELELSNKKSISRINKWDIINLVDTTKFIDSSFAIIGYNIPQSFKVNQKATIKLRISKDFNIESVVYGDRNIPIVGFNSDDRIILETIKVSDTMFAKLYTDSEYFTVELVNSLSGQKIWGEGYTEWIWRVTPLKSGSSYIKMIITMSGRDIVVYEKEIPVDSNWSWSFSNWFSEWWQAITATIITPILIPFGIWLLKRRKSRE